MILVPTMSFQNAPDNIYTEDWEWGFFGREEELNTISRDLSGKRLISIDGRRYLGKSTLAREVYNRIPKRIKVAFRFDRVCDRITTFSSLLNFWKGFYRKINKPFPGDLQDDNDFDEKDEKDVRENFLCYVAKENLDLLIFLDNIDTTWRNNTCFKNYFQSLIKVLITQGGPSLQIMVTSSEALVFSGIRKDALLEFTLKPMELKDSENMLLEIIKQSDSNVELGNYKTPIAILCEGVPMLVFMAACQLTDRNGSYEPEEFVELLLENRMEVMSPEFTPPDDRMSVHIEELIRQADMKDVLFRFIHGIGDLVEGTKFSSNEAMKATGIATSAKAKQLVLIHLQHGFIVGRDGANRNSFLIPGVFRDAMQELQSSDTGEEDEQRVIEHMVRRFESLGLSNISKDDIKQFREDPCTLGEKIKEMWGSSGEFPAGKKMELPENSEDNLNEKNKFSLDLGTPVREDVSGAESSINESFSSSGPYAIRPRSFPPDQQQTVPEPVRLDPVSSIPVQGPPSLSDLSRRQKSTRKQTLVKSHSHDCPVTEDNSDTDQVNFLSSSLNLEKYGQKSKIFIELLNDDQMNKIQHSSDRRPEDPATRHGTAEAGTNISIVLDNHENTSSSTGSVCAEWLPGPSSSQHHIRHHSPVAVVRPSVKSNPNTAALQSTDQSDRLLPLTAQNNIPIVAGQDDHWGSVLRTEFTGHSESSSTIWYDGKDHLPINETTPTQYTNPQREEEHKQRVWNHRTPVNTSI